ncbi:MAG TPA: phosphoribosylaminoimidazolesuccinocarboxamide synthase [Candidatus Babeliaceae bacterium]|nr:phosphoribosylaminoimidazolesuccinocarboxamide synthase [Candidatus Babeliaceae bacterium]
MQLPNQTNFYKGKVRDVYTIADKYMVMLVSDRISAFDVVLPRPIPYKGQVLNQIAAQFLEATKDIVPNWMITVPLPNVTIGYKCETYPVEMVVRGNLTGHAWRTYKSGKRELCGVALPEGLKENDFFEKPIITPTTKAHEGHDEDISREEIISSGLVSKEEYEQLEKYTLALFERGRQMAKERGLILVDTKYEFGRIGDKIYLIDEIHTPDSSRYFYSEGYEERQKEGKQQKQLSKEFVREWLMENGFQGQEGQKVPEMTDEVVNQISERYIELFEVVTGRRFEKQEVNEQDTQKKIEEALKAL